MVFSFIALSFPAGSFLTAVAYKILFNASFFFNSETCRDLVCSFARDSKLCVSLPAIMLLVASPFPLKSLSSICHHLFFTYSFSNGIVTNSFHSTSVSHQNY